MNDRVLIVGSDQGLSDLGIGGFRDPEFRVAVGHFVASPFSLAIHPEIMQDPFVSPCS